MRSSRIFQIILFLIFLNVLNLIAAAQQGSPIWTPQEAIRQEIEERQRRQREFERLQSIGIDRRAAPQTKTRAPIKPTRKDLDAVAINAEDAAKYNEFLKQPNTGIFRLHDLANCDASRQVYNIEEPCPAHLAGKGGAYSFIEEEYRHRWLADITLEKSAFLIQRAATLGFLTDLGDAPLENLTVGGLGIREMAEFVPSVDKGVVQTQRRIAYKGFQVGKYVYKTSQPLKVNSTYALRSIAYRIEGDDAPVALKKGKRADVIVVFRVVRSHEDGSVTILWKELQRKAAPKLIIDKSIAKTGQNVNSAPKKFAAN